MGSVKMQGTNNKKFIDNFSIVSLYEIKIGQIH